MRLIYAVGGLITILMMSVVFIITFPFFAIVALFCDDIAEEFRDLVVFVFETEKQHEDRKVKECPNCNPTK